MCVRWVSGAVAKGGLAGDRDHSRSGRGARRQAKESRLGNSTRRSSSGEEVAGPDTTIRFFRRGGSLGRGEIPKTCSRFGQAEGPLREGGISSAGRSARRVARMSRRGGE